MINIVTSDIFEKSFIRLSKKYPSLEADVDKIVEELEKNPETGKSLDKSRYKIRMAIKSKNSGKRGGARLITLFR